MLCFRSVWRLVSVGDWPSIQTCSFVGVFVVLYRTSSAGNVYCVLFVLGAFCLTSGVGWSSCVFDSLRVGSLVSLDWVFLVISAYDGSVCSRPLESTIFPTDIIALVVVDGVGEALLELEGVCLGDGFEGSDSVWYPCVS